MRRRTYRAHGRINPYMSSPCHIEVETGTVVRSQKNLQASVYILDAPTTHLWTWYYQITLVEKEQAFARADEPERKKESKKKLQKQKVALPTLCRYSNFLLIGTRLAKVLDLSRIVAWHPLSGPGEPRGRHVKNIALLNSCGAECVGLNFNKASLQLYARISFANCPNGKI